jgi:hypothetical protein
MGEGVRQESGYTEIACGAEWGGRCFIKNHFYPYKNCIESWCAPKGWCATEAAVPKTAATQAVPKAGVPRMSTGVKTPSSAEPLLAPGRKQVKESAAPSPTSVPIRKVAGLSQPTTESDDGCVAVCAMLGTPFVVPSSSSSSESSALESVLGLPPPIPDLLISSDLSDILEMPEIEAAQ